VGTTSAARSPARAAAIQPATTTRQARPRQPVAAMSHTDRTDGAAIERACVERGVKMTGQRRVIARVLSQSDDHPDVEELYRRAQVLDPGISIATVYRTVRLFEERGILHRRDFGSGRARYEPTEHGYHHHLIDVETGRVIEFADPAHERVVREIAERLGFELVSLRLELFGRRQAPVGEAIPPATRRKVNGTS
jgi:Fur family transcriptional regulator, ferric uptake regulator